MILVVSLFLCSLCFCVLLVAAKNPAKVYESAFPIQVSKPTKSGKRVIGVVGR